MASQDRFSFLDNMKAIAIVMVVAIHALAFSIDIPAVFREGILIVITTIAVPVFFFIDGYLLGASHALQKKQSYWDSLKKSGVRLLLPWLIFTLLYFVLRFVFEYFNILSERYIIGKDIGYIISALYGSVYAGQMYFLLSLFIVRMFAPLLSKVFNQPPFFLALTLAISFIVAYNFIKQDIFKYLYIKGGQEPLTHAIWGMQFYIVGILFFRLQGLIDVKWLVLPSVIAFIVSASFYTAELFQWAYLICFFVVLQFFSFENKIISYVGRNTMGIYLLHSPLALKVAAIATSQLISNPLIVFITNTLTTLVLAVVMVYFAQKSGLSQYLFGELRAKKRVSV